MFFAAACQSEYSGLEDEGDSDNSEEAGAGAGDPGAGGPAVAGAGALDRPAGVEEVYGTLRVPKHVPRLKVSGDKVRFDSLDDFVEVDDEYDVRFLGCAERDRVASNCILSAPPRPAPPRASPYLASNWYAFCRHEVTFRLGYQHRPSRGAVVMVLSRCCHTAVAAGFHEACWGRG